jgi:hypothetical protein
MKKTLSVSNLAALLLLLVVPLFGQPELTTYGNLSPVVVGAEATIRYKNTQRVARPIPESVVPLLAGLLLTNNVEDQAREQAILRWVDHYDELNQRINLLTEPDRRNRLLSLLNRGDLQRIELELGQSSPHHPLAATFPVQFSRNLVTRGNRSPIIYGDGATVSYVVEQVIQYKLPERISLNLLQQIEEAKTNNTAMAFSLEQERKLVQEWIVKYQAVAEELKKTPGAIAKRAYERFSAGQFEEAIAELRQLEGAMDQVARGAILSARIALLQPISKKSDKVVEAIRKDFARAVALRDSLNDHIAYADFLTNVLNDQQTALKVLDKARPLAITPVQNIQLSSSFCQVAFKTANHQALREYATNGIGILDQQPKALTHKEQLFYRKQFFNHLSFSIYLGAQQIRNAQHSRKLTEIEKTQEKWLIEQLAFYDNQIDLLNDSIYSLYPTDSIQYFSDLITTEGNKLLHRQLSADYDEVVTSYRELLGRAQAIMQRNPEVWFPHYFILKSFFQYSFFKTGEYKNNRRIVDEILAIQREQTNRRATGGYPQEIHPWLTTRMNMALLDNDFVTAQAAIDSADAELVRFVDAAPAPIAFASLYWQLNREAEAKLNALKGDVYPDVTALKAALDWRMGQFSVPPQELQNYLARLTSLAQIYLRHLVATGKHQAAADQLAQTNAHISVLITDHPGGKAMIDNYQLNLTVSVASDLLRHRYHKDAADLFTSCKGLVPDLRDTEVAAHTGMIVPYRMLQIRILYALDATKEARTRVELFEHELRFNESFITWNNASPLLLVGLYGLVLGEEVRLGNKKAAKQFHEKLLAAEKAAAEDYQELTVMQRGWDAWSVLNVRKQTGLIMITKANYLAFYGKNKGRSCRSLRRMVNKGLELIGPQRSPRIEEARADARLLLAVFNDCD